MSRRKAENHHHHQKQRSSPKQATVNEKNYIYFASRVPEVTDDIEKLKVSDVQKEIQPEYLRPNPEFLRVLELQGAITLKNVISLMSHFTSMTTLIFNNIRLDTFQRFYGKFCKTGVETLLFYGGEKLSRDEAHVIGYFNKRVIFTVLTAIRFEPKTRTAGNNKDHNNIYHGGGARNINSPGTERSSIAPPFSGLTSAGTSFSRSSSAENKKSRIPANDISNSVTSSVLSDFLIKCSATLKELTVNRKIFLLNEDVERSQVNQLKLDKFVCDMSANGFEKIINCQKGLKFLGCHNSCALRPYAFEAIIVGVLRNQKSLEEIRLTHKYVFLTENKNLGNTPSVVIHDCGIYADCPNLKHVRLYLSCLQYPDQFDIRPGGLLNTKGFPTTLVSLILRVDVIRTAEMKNFAQKFPEYLTLRYFIIEGNEKSPFTMNLEWIKRLVKLPEIQVFELTNYRLSPALEEEEELHNFIQETAPNVAKFQLKSTSCVYWRTGNIQWETQRS